MVGGTGQLYLQLFNFAYLFEILHWVLLDDNDTLHCVTINWLLNPFPQHKHFQISPTTFTPF